MNLAIATLTGVVTFMQERPYLWVIAAVVIADAAILLLQQYDIHKKGGFRW